MRIMVEGSLTLTGGADPLPGALPATCGHIWVGAGSSNSANARVGASDDPAQLLEASDQKGFLVLHDNPSSLRIKGTAGNVVHYAVIG